MDHVSSSDIEFQKTTNEEIKFSEEISSSFELNFVESDDQQATLDVAEENFKLEENLKHFKHILEQNESDAIEYKSVVSTLNSNLSRILESEGRLAELLNDRESQLTQGEETQKNLENQVLSLKNELSLEQRISGELKQEIDALNSRINDLESNKMALRSRIEDLERVAENKIENLQSAKQKILEHESNLLNIHQRIGVYEAEIGFLKESLAESELDSENLRREIREKNKNHETEIDNLLGQVSLLENSLDSEKAEGYEKDQEIGKLSSEIISLKTDLTIIEEKNQEINKITTASAIYKKQVETYHHFSLQEKKKYQKIIFQMAKEIQHAISVHPLRDYLILTEKELSRVETELRRTPELAVHRNQLETLLDQLISQRNYLRDIVEKTEKSLLKFGEPLDKLLKNVGSMALPPKE